MKTILITLIIFCLSHSGFSVQKPNIIFIFTDDHAPKALSAYGSGLNHTPNLDRLANEGMKFERCLVTNAICGPSRAVVLTGKYSHLNGFMCNFNKFDGSQQTFPKILRNNGYQTAIIGKWHLVSTPTGFDHFDILIGQGKYYNTPTLTGDIRSKAKQIKNVGYTTDVITDKALDWIKNQRHKDKPFMLMYQHKAPHGRWEPAPEHLNLYDDITIPEPNNLFDDYQNRASGAKNQNMNLAETFGPNRAQYYVPEGLSKEEFMKWHKAYDPNGLHLDQIDKSGTKYKHQKYDRSPEDLEKWHAAFLPKNEAYYKANYSEKEMVRWKYQRYMKNYLRCVKSVDDNVGRLLNYLDESGLAENTVVIYSSDQGFFLGEHGWFDKRWAYEPSVKAPLLVRWPKVIRANSVNHHLVSNLDFAQTILDIAGVSIPNDMQGNSLVPLFKGENPKDWRKYHYYQYFEGDINNPERSNHHVPRHASVIGNRYKLIHYYQLDEWELFDIAKDPDEMKNQYHNPEFKHIRDHLTQQLSLLRKQYLVPTQDPAGAGLGHKPHQ